MCYEIYFDYIIVIWKGVVIIISYVYWERNNGSKDFCNEYYGESG